MSDQILAREPTLLDRLVALAADPMAVVLSVRLEARNRPDDERLTLQAETLATPEMIRAVVAALSGRGEGG